jgi:hypothetical protein
MITAKVRDILINSPELAALVADRIYPVTIPQDEALPCLVCSVVSETPSDCKEESSHQDDIRMQVSVFSKTYKQAVQIKEALRKTLDRYTDSSIANIRYLNFQELFEKEVRVYHLPVDFMISLRR